MGSHIAQINVLQPFVIGNLLSLFQDMYWGGGKMLHLISGKETAEMERRF